MRIVVFEMTNICAADLWSCSYARASYEILVASIGIA